MPLSGRNDFPGHRDSDRDERLHHQCRRHYRGGGRLDGNIYIPDGYAADPSRVIKVTAAGAASLLTPAGITFSRPEGATADGMGNLYIADGGHNRIVEITTAGVASVLAFNSLPSPRTSLTIPATRTHARPLLLFLQARHATLRWCLLRNRWAA
jgi:hypothetical protein